MKRMFFALTIALMGWNAVAQKVPHTPVDAGNHTGEVKGILVRSMERCRTVTCGHYEMDVVTKYLSQPDTSRSHIIIDYRQVPEDTVFGRHFSHTTISGGKEIHALYGGKELIRYDDSKGTVYPLAYCSERRNVLEYRLPFFLPLSDSRCRPIDAMLEVGDNGVFCLGDTLLDDRPCHWIVCSDTQRDTDADLGVVTTRHKVELWIDKRDYMPVRFDEHLDMTEEAGTMKQYWSYALKSLSPEVEAKLLTREAVPSSVQLKEYDSTTEKVKPLAEGKQAPDWTLTTTTGDTVRLSDFRGKVVLLDFFFKSCAPCCAAMPWLQRLHEKYEERGLVMVGIDPFDASQKEVVASFMSLHGINYTVVFADREVTKAYGVNSYPTLFLIDRTGKIVKVQLGYLQQREEEMERQLETMLQ